VEHAGFDGLHNSLGVALVCASLLLITAIIIFGSTLVKAAMAREKAVRQQMRQGKQDQP